MRSTPQKRGGGCAQHPRRGEAVYTVGRLPLADAERAAPGDGLRRRPLRPIVPACALAGPPGGDEGVAPGMRQKDALRGVVVRAWDHQRLDDAVHDQPSVAVGVDGVHRVVPH
eukprot:2280378-Pyramimonas_sp.AAC.1